jgi:hypothetical protein
MLPSRSFLSEDAVTKEWKSYLAPRAKVPIYFGVSRSLFKSALSHLRTLLIGWSADLGDRSFRKPWFQGRLVLVCFPSPKVPKEQLHQSRLPICFPYLLQAIDTERLFVKQSRRRKTAMTEPKSLIRLAMVSNCRSLGGDGLPDTRDTAVSIDERKGGKGE